MIRRRSTSDGPRYDVIWREGDKQRSRTFRTKRDATLHEAEVRRTKASGAYHRGSPSKTTLSIWLDQWMESGRPSWSPTTVKQRESALRKWVRPSIGSIPLADLGPERVREWHTWLARSTSPTNANNVTAVLSAAMGAAARDGLIPYNPCGALRRVRKNRPARRRPPWQEARRVLPYLSGHDRVRAALMLYAGLRPGEASTLRWGDVHDDRIVVAGSAQGPTKTGVVRSMPLPRELAAELELVTRGAPDDLVAPSRTGVVMSTHNFQTRVMRPAARAAGVEVHQYDLRHACATHLLVDERVPPVLVASYLGHSPETLLRVYADSLPSL
jgi:integrase